MAVITKKSYCSIKDNIFLFYSRNQAELNRLQESVHRLRNDYERCIDSYIVAKAKYEDQYTKVSMGGEILSTLSKKT